MLEEICKYGKPECEDFWDNIWLHMTWGLDVLRDFAVYGRLEERGKKAALERMTSILKTQKARKFKKDDIQENLRKYVKNWFEHPRLAFEIPKAYLHECCIHFLAYSRLNKCLCPQVADYFAFTRWLGYQPYKEYMKYRNLADKRDCSGCEQNRDRSQEAL